MHLRTGVIQLIRLWGVRKCNAKIQYLSEYAKHNSVLGIAIVRKIFALNSAFTQNKIGVIISCLLAVYAPPLTS